MGRQRSLPGKERGEIGWQAEGECLDRDRLALPGCVCGRPRPARDCGGREASPRRRNLVSISVLEPIRRLRQDLDP
jgi:hypothetical protein